MKQLLIILSIFGFMSACKKDKDKKEEEKIYFSGIVSTDQNGNLISSNDTTDWRSDDIWVSKEVSLFSRTYNTNCAPPAVAQSVVTYPNPTPGLFFLIFFKPENTMVNLRLVDENFKTIFSKDSVTEQRIAINIDSLNIQDTARLYYKFINNGCEYRGHGDIVFGK